MGGSGINCREDWVLDPHIIEVAATS